MRPDIADEAHLLLCCARSSVCQSAAERAKRLAGKDLNWECVAQYATHHQVIPLVYNGLLQACEAEVPAPFLAQLKERASQYATRNRATKKLLVSVLNRLENQGISAIPFKGITFALANYQSLKLRQCGDIDILVRRQDFLKAKDLLIRDGFSEIYFGHHEAATVQAQLFRETDKQTIDLHYGITPHYYPDLPEAENGSRLKKEDWNRRVTGFTYWHFYLDPDPMWARLVPLQLSGKTISILSPEDALLLASVQGVKDLWLSLRRVCDIAELLRTNASLDWDFVWSQVRELNFERKFSLGMRLAHELLDAPLEEPVLRKMQKHSLVGALATQTRAMLFAETQEADRLGFRLSSNILTMDTLRDRYRYSLFAVSRLGSDSRFPITLRRYCSFLRMLSVPFIFLLRRGVSLA